MSTQAVTRKNTSKTITDSYAIPLCSSRTAVSSLTIVYKEQLATVVLKQCWSKLTISYNLKKRDSS